MTASLPLVAVLGGWQFLADALAETPALAAELATISAHHDGDANPLYLASRLGQ